MENYFIIMSDIIKSRKYEGDALMRDFRMLVSDCNLTLAEGILSPYTITLGDEFQGVSKSLNWSVQSILHLEESALQRSVPFRLRYVVHYGQIESPLNPEIAHAMVGPGLIRARELLTDKRRGQPRFRFDLPNKRLATHLSGLFRLLSSLTEAWGKTDVNLIFEMMTNDDNLKIGERYKKTRTQIWKLRKNTHIQDYKTLRDIVLDLSQQ